eukprot:9682266-Alexandrium_andersonii.AAC.1
MGSAPVRAKARLCCGGHRDPDLMEGEMRTDAPTTPREVLRTPLSIAPTRGGSTGPRTSRARPSTAERLPGASTWSGPAGAPRA